MKRREFLAAGAAAGSSWWLPRVAHAAPAMTAVGARASIEHNLLILVELKGGNDGLNTVMPLRDPLYRAYRPRIALDPDAVIALDEHTALHPALAPLMPLWHAQQLAIVQGVGYERSNLSHFRSIEIWDTASRAHEYLRDGWLARAFAQCAMTRGIVATGAAIGSAEKGPLANGTSTRAIAHARCGSHAALKTTFPSGAFGTSIATAMQMLAANDGAIDESTPPPRIAAIRLTLNGFDTHRHQPLRHAVLLAQFAAGMVAMRDALVELGRWDSTLIVTYSEFGRSVRENGSLGTDHGTASAHFVAGGRVRGGLYGDAPRLARVDGNGNLPIAVDFRRIYATVLGAWWSLDAHAVLRQRFEPLPLLRV